MRYLGSKRRWATRMLPYILKYRHPAMLYIEPFCGGCNMLERVSGKWWGNDVNRYIIAYFQAIQDGWKPPKHITEEQYAEIRQQWIEDDAKESLELEVAALYGYAGFSFAFAGEFMGHTYAREWAHKSKEENEAYRSEASYRVYEGTLKKMAGVVFSNLPYDLLDIPAEPCLIYCDPPYEGYDLYKNKQQFNHGEYWQWVRALSDAGHTVYCSEYQAPPDFTCIWEYSYTKSIANNSEGNHRGKRMERLFMYTPHCLHKPFAQQKAMF